MAFPLLGQTNDLNMALCLVRKLDSGTLFVNITPLSPFGGLGISGFDRDGGKTGLEEFTQIKGLGLSILPE